MPTSVGIASAATILTASTSRYHDLLAAHVTMYDPATRQWLQRVGAAMVRAGTEVHTATQRALALLNAGVERQAVVLAYNHVFALVAFLFLAVVPLVVVLRGKGGSGATLVLE